MSLLAMYCGYQIDWSGLNQDKNIQASIDAYNGDETSLQIVLEPLLDWVDKDYFYFRMLDDTRAVVDYSVRDWPV